MRAMGGAQGLGKVEMVGQVVGRPGRHRNLGIVSAGGGG